MSSYALIFRWNCLVPRGLSKIHLFAEYSIGGFDASCGSSEDSIRVKARYPSPSGARSSGALSAQIGEGRNGVCSLMQMESWAISVDTRGNHQAAAA
jgi:hypothetical protein